MMLCQALLSEAFLLLCCLAILGREEVAGEPELLRGGECCFICSGRAADTLGGKLLYRGRRLWFEFGALGEGASFTPGEEGAAVGDSDGGPGGVEGCRGGVTLDSTGSDSGSLSGDT